MTEGVIPFAVYVVKKGLVMQKSVLFLVSSIMAFMISLTGCGGGDGGSDTVTSMSTSQTVLGPLAGATISVYRLNDLNSSIENIVANTNTTDLEKAGTFSLALNGIGNDEWLLLKSTGGVDIDANDDGIIDINKTKNRGVIYAIAQAKDIREGIYITVMSDIIYRRLSSENNLADLNNSAIFSKINALVSNYLNDVNGDGVITYSDIVSFSPSRDKLKSKIDWNDMLDIYISAIHNGNDDKTLQKKLNFVMTVNQLSGYSHENNSTALLVKSQSATTTIIKTIDSDLDGSANAAIMEQSNGKVFAQTKIYQNAAGENGFKYAITNEHGDTLHIYFNGAGNLLAGMSENDLQNLADSGQISFTQISDSNGTHIKLTFPKSIMSLWSDTNMTIKLNNTYLKKEYLKVINNDPVISWNIHPICTDNNGDYIDCEDFCADSDNIDEPQCAYKKPTCVDQNASIFSKIIHGVCVDYKLPDDNITSITLTQEPILYNNSNDLTVNYREGQNGCQASEIHLFDVDALEDAVIKVKNSSNYQVCISNKNNAFNLTNTGTELFSYNSEGLVNQALTLANVVKLGTDSSSYTIVAEISREEPEDSTVSGWSSLLSFESISNNGNIGDAGYEQNRILWIGVKNTNVNYHKVVSPVTGRIWLDRNLGASRVCRSLTDSLCYGNYYEWGRNADGHENSYSNTTFNQASSIGGAGSSFIIAGTNTGNNDWFPNDSSGQLRISNWSRTNGSSVCPIGYRVPTKAEFVKEMAYVDYIPNEMFSFLKLPYSGWRKADGGTLEGQGVFGEILLNSLHSTSPLMHDIFRIENGLASFGWSNPIGGASVRCIQDTGTSSSSSISSAKIVFDTQNNLMWQKIDDGNLYDFNSAKNYCTNLSLGGYSDWRLPDIGVLKLLVDSTKSNPSINPLFANTKGDYYWSSTVFQQSGSTSLVGVVNFQNGQSTQHSSAYNHYVRCVR